MVGPSCICSACRCKPGANNPWASTASGSRDKSAPAGDACQRCASRHQSAFGHFSWEEYCEFVGTDEGKHAIEQYEKTSSGAEPDFIQDSVESKMTVCYRLERSVFVLAQAEYKKEMQKAGPGSRGPKTPIVKLPSETTGEMIDHFVFSDPDRPYRRLIISTEVADVKHTHRLGNTENMYDKQGDQIWRVGLTATAEQTSMKKILEPNIQLLTIEEHLSKVNPDLYQARFPEEEPEASAAADLHDDGSPEDAMSCVVPSAPADETPHKPNKLLRSISQSLVAHTSPATKNKGRAQSSSAISPRPPLVANASVSADITSADSVSQVGGSNSNIDDDPNFEDVKFRSMTSGQKLAVLKTKLPLLDLLNGSKLGRSERAVYKYLSNGKLFDQDIKLLRNYLKQVDWGDRRADPDFVSELLCSWRVAPNFVFCCWMRWRCRH